MYWFDTAKLIFSKITHVEMKNVSDDQEKSFLSQKSEPKTSILYIGVCVCVCVCVDIHIYIYFMYIGHKIEITSCF